MLAWKSSCALAPLVLFRLHSLLFLLLFALPGGYCQVTQPELRGDENIYDQKTGEVLLRGNAQAIVGETEILADEIRYSMKQRVASAKGGVVLTTATQRLLAERLTYAVDTGIYSVDTLRVGQPPLFLSSKRAFGSPGRILLRDAIATWSEPGPWTPTLKAVEIDYESAGKGRFRAHDARVGLGDVLPVKLPRFEYDLNSPLHSSATLRGGYRGELGAFIGAGLRWPVSSGWRIGGDVDLYSARGILIGPGAAYSIDTRDGVRMTGRFSSGYINDVGDREKDVLGRPIPERRGYLTWEHMQRVNQSLSIDLALNYWKDSEVLRDFRRDQFVRVQTPDTTLEATYFLDNQAFTLLGRFQPNAFHSVQERLPELRWDLLPVQLPLGWFGRGSTSIAVLREDPPGNSPNGTLRSDRLDLYFGLNRNFSQREWLGMTPVLGGRLTHYRRTQDEADRDHYTRALGEVGLDTHIVASGVFDYKNERWGIDGLRHIVRPYASYRFVPEADKGRRYVPRIDRDVFLPHLADIGIADPLHIDDFKRMNVLRIGLENRLQTRDRDYGSRDLARFTLANDFRFSRELGERAVAPTSMELALSPLSWLEASVYQSIETRDLSWQQTGASLTLRDADVWTLRFSAHHLKSEISEYAAEYGRRLNETFTAYGRWRYDARRGRWYEQAYDLGHNLGNAWHLRYGVTLYDGPRRESSFQFHIEIETRSF